jgi:hypothetical protein
MIWLLDARQTVRLKNIEDPFDFARDCAALELLWSRPNDNEDLTGMVSDGDIVDIVLRTSCQNNGYDSFAYQVELI